MNAAQDYSQVPIYLINLERRVDRLTNMQRRLSGLNFTRISAYDGEKLNPGLGKNRVISSKLTPYEIGCYLSHETIWQKIMENNIPIACILEDDIVLGSDFPRFMDLSIWQGLDFDVIKLDNWPRKISVTRKYLNILGRKAHRILSTTYSSACYLISNKCAHNLLQASQTINFTVDVLKFDTAGGWLQKNHVYQLVPSIGTQEIFISNSPTPSDIEDSRIKASNASRVERPRGLKKIHREAKRIFRQLAELLKFIIDSIKSKRIDVYYE